MDIKIVKPPPISGEIRAIASKSQAHRLLICAALSDKGTFIECAESSDDIEATVGCITALGAVVRRENTGYHVTPVPRPVSDVKRTLDCLESGSTFRFMLPVACALGAQAEFILRGRLPSRPISPLTDELKRHGGVITGEGGSPVCCAGRLQGGEFALPGDISSQFISGLLLALPLLGSGSIIKVSGREESKPYIDMTLDALKLFGIEIERNGGYSIQLRKQFPAGWLCEGAQLQKQPPAERLCEMCDYRSPEAVTVEGDWSNAAFWLCLGAVGGGSVTCTNLNLNSSQGDMAVTGILERFGAVVSYGTDSVTVKPDVLRGIAIDAGDTPDLVPVLAAVAACAEGETVIYNAERLRIKESDRLKAVSVTLGALGADIRETDDGLIIRGGKRLRGGEVSSFGDHRIAMTAAVASAVCDSTVTIRQAEAVRKSYPGFFDDFCKLGGEVSEV